MTLINKMLKELKINQEARKRFNELRQIQGDPAKHSYYYDKNQMDWVFQIAGVKVAERVMLSPGYSVNWKGYNHLSTLIQTLLSKGVMPFSDVDTEFEEFQNNHEGIEYMKLSKLLYTKFTNARYNGKSLDEAINIIEEIYKEYE
jgi:hypothetical protein